nr:DNA polymerase III subunit alpha [Moraxellaceae bacterium]
PEEMAKQREIFLAGAKEKEIDDDVAGGVFDLMEKFAEYGFNKSHSACYGVLAYQTAYLKHYYPAEFMSAVLTSEMNNTDSVVFLINDCRENFGLTVANPSVNHSEWYFVPNTTSNIIYGLGAIKGVGEGAVESIVQARKQGGKFTDLFDFCCRVDTKKVNKRSLEALIRAGCFDDFAKNLRPELAEDKAYQIRGALFKQLPQAVQASEQERQNREFGSFDLFAEIDNVTKAPPLPNDPKLIWSDKERLKLEKSTLGLYLTGHPIDEYRAELKHYTGGNQLQSLSATKFNDTILFAGLIIDVANFGNRIAITIDDGTARQEVSCTQDKFNRLKDILKVDNVVIIKGSVSEFNDRLYAKVFDVYSILEARLRWLKKISIKLHADDVETVERLQPLLKSQQTSPIDSNTLDKIQRASNEDNGYDNSGDVGDDDIGDYDNIGGYDEEMAYDEFGNPLSPVGTDNDPYGDRAYPTARDIKNKDGCIELGINVYDYYAIANVQLSNAWRMYPTDDNISTLRRIVGEEGMYWHW